MRRRGGAALALALALSACAPTPRAVVTRPPPLRPAAEPEEGDDRAGVIHVVKKGQTLFRIARVYGVEVAVLMETNGIEDPRAVSVGQELFVPGARAVLEVPPAPAPLPPEAEPERPADARGAARPPSAPPPTPAPPTEPAVVTAPPAATLSWPLRGVLYSRFGLRGKARHDGIDIAAPEGSPVTAAEDGEAIFVGVQAGYGKVVILRHAHNLVTVYAHNSAVLVREGEHVARGQIISRVGQTGRTTGPHLHFEVRDAVKPRNPLLYLP